MLLIGSDVRRRQMARRFTRQIDTCGAAQSAAPAPFEQRPCAELFAIVKKIDVAASRQCLAERDWPMPDAPTAIYGAPLPVGRVEITLTCKRLFGIEAWRF